MPTTRTTDRTEDMLPGPPSRTNLRALASIASLTGLLGVAIAGCVKPEDGADVAGLKRRTPAPTPVPSKGPNPPPPYSACEVRCNVYTRVDGWQLRYAPTWGSNVLVTLVDANDPTSLVFTHPTRELAYKGIASEGACVETPAVSMLETSYPVVDGRNLFSAEATAGGEAYRYVFVTTNRKYVAVSRGAEGCASTNRNKPGSCYVFGAVDGNRVTPVGNTCVAGYQIQGRASGIPARVECKTGAPVTVKGQAFPAAFLLIHDKPGWDPAGECETPKFPPTDPTPLVSVTPRPGMTPPPHEPPAPTVPGKPGIVITPQKGGVPVPPAQTVPTQPPPPPCDPWSKTSTCADGWTKDGAPRDAVPPTPPPLPTIYTTPVQTSPSSPIWYKK